MQLNDLRTQQRGWLSEAYPGLFPIAAAITHNPKIAEDVVSDALLATLTRIDLGMCRAQTKPQLFAFVRQVVRHKAKTTIGAGADRNKRRSLCRGDILADLHAEHVRRTWGVSESAIDESGEDLNAEK